MNPYEDYDKLNSYIKTEFNRLVKKFNTSKVTLDKSLEVYENIGEDYITAKCLYKQLKLNSIFLAYLVNDVSEDEYSYFKTFYDECFDKFKAVFNKIKEKLENEKS